MHEPVTATRRPGSSASPGSPPVTRETAVVECARATPPAPSASRPPRRPASSTRRPPDVHGDRRSAPGSLAAPAVIEVTIEPPAGPQPAAPRGQLTDFVSAARSATAGSRTASGRSASTRPTCPTSSAAPGTSLSSAPAAPPSSRPARATCGCAPGHSAVVKNSNGDTCTAAPGATCGSRRQRQPPATGSGAASSPSRPTATSGWARSRGARSCSRPRSATSSRHPRRDPRVARRATRRPAGWRTCSGGVRRARNKGETVEVRAPHRGSVVLRRPRYTPRHRVTPGLRKSYGEQSCPTASTSTSPRARIFALLGPNGAGKTTIVQTRDAHLRRRRDAAGRRPRYRRASRTAVRAAIGVTGQFSAVDTLLTAA